MEYLLHRPDLITLTGLNSLPTQVAILRYISKGMLINLPGPEFILIKLYIKFF